MRCPIPTDKYAICKSKEEEHFKNMYSEYTILLMILNIVTGTYKTGCNVTFSIITTNKKLFFVYNENPNYEWVSIVMFAEVTVVIVQ